MTKDVNMQTLPKVDSSLLDKEYIYIPELSDAMFPKVLANSTLEGDLDMIQTTNFSREEIERKHEEYVEHMKKLIPLISKVKDRSGELHKIDEELYGPNTNWEPGMREDLEAINYMKVASEFGITSEDVDIIWFGDPFDWLIQNGDITQEEFDQLYLSGVNSEEF